MSDTTKRKHAKSIFDGGLEGTLETTGLIVATICVFSGIWALVQAGILLAVVFCIAGVVCRLVLCALAEIIRLKKKALGLNYGGRISEPREHVMHACGECGATLYSNVRCDSCGRRIEEGA